MSELLWESTVANSSAPVGQVEFTSPGTTTWVAPADVTSVCVVAVGPGGKPPSGQSLSPSAGGGLGWKNNIPVTPGSSYTVQVGNAELGTDSFFISSTTVAGKAPMGTTGGTFVGDGGGNGGSVTAGAQSGGGGAGGYSGNGGAGANGNTAGSSGNGGGGGGGGGGGLRVSSPNVYYWPGAGGGGVGLKGQGASGTGGTAGATGSTSANGAKAQPGAAGSNGTSGTAPTANATTNDGGSGGSYGGGGGAQGAVDDGSGSAGGGGTSGPSQNGAVRIIWGAGRAFPSTNTGDM